MDRRILRPAVNGFNNAMEILNLHFLEIRYDSPIIRRHYREKCLPSLMEIDLNIVIRL